MMRRAKKKEERKKKGNKLGGLEGARVAMKKLE
jgi:hypothetical protein